MTGIPASSAFLVGASNALASIRQTQIPSAPAEIAVFMAETICPTSLVSEPVHWCSVLKIAPMSSIPYWVGTKNGFVVTWLTKTHFHFGVSGYLPTPLAELLPPPPQAARSAGSESA